MNEEQNKKLDNFLDVSLLILSKYKDSNIVIDRILSFSNIDLDARRETCNALLPFLLLLYIRRLSNIKSEDKDMLYKFIEIDKILNNHSTVWSELLEWSKVITVFKVVEEDIKKSIKNGS